MPNTMRWRYGDTNPLMVPVLKETIIEIGDLVYVEIGNAYPALNLRGLNDPISAREFFRNKFAGVAMQANRQGDQDSVRVATSGVFEFQCLPNRWMVGDKIGIAFGGGRFSSQTVMPAAGKLDMIGRCAKTAGPDSTRVLVDIFSVVYGPPQFRADPVPRKQWLVTVKGPGQLHDCVTILIDTPPEQWINDKSKWGSFLPGADAACLLMAVEKTW